MRKVFRSLGFILILSGVFLFFSGIRSCINGNLDYMRRQDEALKRPGRQGYESGKFAWEFWPGTLWLTILLIIAGITMFAVTAKSKSERERETKPERDPYACDHPYEYQEKFDVRTNVHGEVQVKYRCNKCSKIFGWE